VKQLSKGGLNMAKVMAKLIFEEYDKWRPAFDEAENVRKAHGVIDTQVFRGSDNPNEVVILYEWDDLEHAWPFFEQPDNRKVLENLGLQGKPEVFILKKRDIPF
jgi:heme-degrading monooxygenase HmoA